MSFLKTVNLFELTFKTYESEEASTQIIVLRLFEQKDSLTFLNIVVDSEFIKKIPSMTF